MIRIVISHKGLEKLPGQLQRFRIGITERLGRMLTLSGEEIVGTSREDYLSGPRPEKLGRVSGDLARQTTYEVRGGRVVIGTNLAYGRTHEEGGTIKAKSGGRLVFRLGDGQWRSAKEVHIPARPFLRTALKDSVKSIQSIVEQQTQAALREAMA